MTLPVDQVFELLPAWFRSRDSGLVAGVALLTAAEQAELTALLAVVNPDLMQQARLDYLVAKRDRGPLASLLAVIGEQVLVIEENLRQRYDDQFIETCANWVIPYIGDVIGYQGVHAVAPDVSSTRAEVGHTISFRRRKGTAAMLEELARGVTGWGACAVEFFQRLGDTQHLNHLRPQCLYAPDMRQWEPLYYIGGAFDTLSHTVDVRRIASGRGRFNIPNIGIFLWRLSPFAATAVVPRADPAAPWRFWMSPLGNDMPLFNNPQTEEPVTHLARPIDVPDPIGLRVMDAHLPDYYGQSVQVLVNGAAVDPAQVRVCNLKDDAPAWLSQPGDGKIVIDPRSGRLVLPTSIAPGAGDAVTVSFHRGFSAAMGGGEYARAASFAVAPNAGGPVQRVPADQPTIQGALNALGGAGVVEIADNGTYAEALSIDASVANATLELRAADGFMPTLLLQAGLDVRGAAHTTVALNGLQIAQAPIRVPAAPDASGRPNQLSALRITHCTLVPGGAIDRNNQPADPAAASLVVELPDTALTLAQSISGAIRSDPSTSTTASDSIIDATVFTSVAYAGLDAASAGGTLSLDAVTVIGKINAKVMKRISNSVLLAALSPADTWTAPVLAERRQLGCVRFTYLPVTSRVPSRYRCQPPLPGENVAAHCVVANEGLPVCLGPRFTSLRFGTPGYAQMEPVTADAIRRGASDEGEMGAFHQLYQPQREANLRVRLVEYLRVGLAAGIFYET
jgi:hypothetical protein